MTSNTTTEQLVESLCDASESYGFEKMEGCSMEREKSAEANFLAAKAALLEHIASIKRIADAAVEHNDPRAIAVRNEELSKSLSGRPSMQP